MKAFMPPDNGINWWRDIPGYDGKYQANRIRDIRRTFKNGLVRDMTPYRKKNKERRKRLFVKLTHNGKTKEVLVLQIMAKTWYGEYNKNLIPYHKNGIVTDNRLDNIGFSGKSELGKMTGHMSGKRKPVIKISKEGEEIEIYRSARQAAKENNMSYQTVLDRCNNKIKKPYELDGYTYQFEK